MGRLTALAQRKDRGSEESSRHRLTIAGKDFTHRLIDASITYTSDLGGSGAELTILGGLDHLRDAPVSLYIGYGKYMVPYFVGRLQTPKSDELMQTSTAVAYGPFKLMSDQVLGSDEDFQGKTLEWVIMELAWRAGHSPGDIEVRGGQRYKVPPGEPFSFDQTMNDVLGTLLDKANFIAYDHPGGKRIFRPRPTPGTVRPPRARYTPDQYVSMNVDPTNEFSYSKVVVYRRNETGSGYAVYTERDIQPPGRYKPPRRRWYVVSDFPGNGVEAATEAYNLATSMREGENTFSMSALANPELRLYDTFRATKARKLSNGETQMQTFLCSIDNSIEIGVSAGEMTMEVSGTCYELVHERREQREGPVRYGLSSGIIRRPLGTSPAPEPAPVNIVNAFVGVQSGTDMKFAQFPTNDAFPTDSSFPAGNAGKV